MPTVAISDGFLDAFASLPKVQQRKVREFTKKFRINPTAASINYERISCAKDPRIRTVRIGSDYRAVVLHPNTGDTYLLLWVDHHDEAMEWTRNRNFEINPNTGALQIVDTADAAPATSASGCSEQRPALFQSISNEALIGFGVPKVLIPSIRALESTRQLEDIQKHLPAEAAEALVWLAEGIPAGEIALAIDKPSATVAAVDTLDLPTALNHPDSRRRFVIIDSDRDLNAVLDGPLAKWRIFLHPSQERIVRRTYNGPACVLGCAGTGKTVVAMHRTKFLLQKVFTSKHDRVLFTTFTANLARDIRVNLQNLCGDEIERVDVIHLDSWAASFLNARGCTFDVAIGEEITRFWAEAALSTGSFKLSTSFLRQEWEQVIQARDIETPEEYLQLARTGRGALLSRADRSKVWETCAVFRNLLALAGKSEHADIIRQARQHLETERAHNPYRAIVVDEVQDLPPQKLRLLRAMVADGPNDLFVVGDPSQRIYGQKVSLSSCGIFVRGRSSTLKVNYRTTEQIRSWAVRLLAGVPIEDMDGNGQPLLGYRSLMSGPSPEVRLFRTLREEQEFLLATIKDALRDRSAEEICLVTRTSNALRKDYLPTLEGNGVPCAITDKSSDLPKDKIRLATMHRVKGLEFPFVILAGTNRNAGRDLRDETQSDAQAQVDYETRERSLLFVAATRARDRLLITGFGEGSPYLN
jgi:hypothetical protein